MDEAVGVAGPGGRGLRLRERMLLRGDGGYLERDGPTDRVDLHHLSLRPSPPGVREDGADDTLGARVA